MTQRESLLSAWIRQLAKSILHDGRQQREHGLDDEADPLRVRTLRAAAQVLREQNTRNLRAYAEAVEQARVEREAHQTPEEVLAGRQAAMAEFVRTFDPHMWRNTRDVDDALATLGAPGGTPAAGIADSEDARRSGHKPIVTLAQVEAVRDSLGKQGRPNGLRSIAKELSVSVATVRRRLEGR